MRRFTLATFLAAAMVGCGGEGSEPVTPKTPPELDTPVSVDPGTYRLDISSFKKEYKDWKKEGVELKAGDAPVVEVELGK